MGLSNDLLETNMSLPCVRCTGQIIHLGKWFKAVAHVECPFCGMTMVWGHQMKLRLFQRYEAAPIVYLVRPFSGAEGRLPLAE